jgi:hypothetical protein
MGPGNPGKFDVPGDEENCETELDPNIAISFTTKSDEQAEDKRSHERRPNLFRT